MRGISGRSILKTFFALGKTHLPLSPELSSLIKTNKFYEYDSA